MAVIHISNLTNLVILCNIEPTPSRSFKYNPQLWSNISLSNNIALFPTLDLGPSDLQRLLGVEQNRRAGASIGDIGPTKE